MLPRVSFCDVLVIGGGTAALCAAIAARQAGAAVWLVERAPCELRGGDSRHARNFRIMHPAPTRFAPGCYGEDEFSAELQRAADGHGDAVLQRLLVRRSGTLIDWLAGLAVRFQELSSDVLPSSRRTVFFLGGGKAVVNALYAAAHRLGVKISYGCRATALRLEDGTVREVGIADAAGSKTVRARAVVLCSGGYQADRERLRAVWGGAADRFVLRGGPYATGELLHDLLAQGVASVGRPAACHLVAVDARAPCCDGGIVTRAVGIPAGVVVDRDGKRFHDEAADIGPTRYRAWGRLLARCPGQGAHLILDEAAERRLRPSLFPPVRAATVAELAGLTGLDPLALQATVGAFNAAIHAPAAGDAACTEGIDPPKTRWARPLLSPPFGAIPLRPGITFTCHGVRVDTSARVLLADGHATKNLFAAGIVMAPNLLGTGYLAGTAMTIGAAFGRIAGTAAAHVRA